MGRRQRDESPQRYGDEGTRRRRPSSSGDAFDRERVRDEAGPVLERWQSGVELFNVKRRLRGVLSAGLVIIAIQFLLNPGGLAGVLVTLWFLLSVPVVVITACILVLLKDPTNAPKMWWENSIPATVGLLSLVGFTRAAQTTPAGRSVWQFLFGSDHPTEEQYQFGTDDSDIDLSAVARIRRYIWYVIVGSAGLALASEAVRRDIFGTGVFEGLLGIDPGAGAWLGLFIVLIIVGFFCGALARAADL